MTFAGLALALLSAVAINGGYAAQHRAAGSLPPLSLRRPVRSLVSLFRHGRWLAGFFAGIGGWVLYVAALALAPISLVQACSAGGIAVLAIGAGRLARMERIGLVASLAGLALLGLSLGAKTPSTHGSWVAVAVCMGQSIWSQPTDFPRVLLPLCVVAFVVALPMLSEEPAPEPLVSAP